MITYHVALYGLITRDIRWRRIEARDEDHLREICEDKFPGYRIEKINVPAQATE